MQYKISDPEVLMLATIAGTLKGDYVREGPADPWAGSPFAWIRTRRRFILVDHSSEALEVMARRFDGVEGLEWVGFHPTRPTRT